MRPRLLTSVIAVALATFLLGACSSGSSTSTTADFNDDDVMFAQMMIPHHEQAIELADIALDPAVGASTDIRTLATEIKNAQDPEIEQMTEQPTRMSTSGR